MENVDFSQFDQTAKGDAAQSQPTYDPIVTKVARAKLSMNHTLDEITAQYEAEQIIEAEESRQRPDGMWDCAHKCKNKQTWVSISVPGESC